MVDPGPEKMVAWKGGRTSGKTFVGRQASERDSVAMAHVRGRRIVGQRAVFRSRIWRHRPVHGQPFLSVGPQDRRGVIVLDADLMVTADLYALWQLLDDFAPTHLYGLVREMQPSYRRLRYAQRNFTGAFNGGVQMHHLANIRAARRAGYTTPLAGVMDNKNIKHGLRFSKLGDQVQPPLLLLPGSSLLFLRLSTPYPPA